MAKIRDQNTIAAPVISALGNWILFASMLCIGKITHSRRQHRDALMLFVVDVLKVIVFAHRCSWRLCASLLFLRQYSEAGNL